MRQNILLLSVGMFSHGLINVSTAETSVDTTRLAADIIIRARPDGQRVLVVDKLELPDRTPDPDPEPRHLSQRERERGYLLYQRRASDGVFRHSAPMPDESIEGSRTSLAQGETRHVQFAVYALRDLGTVTAAARPLTTTEGQGLGATVEIHPVQLGYWRNYWHPLVEERGKLLAVPDAPVQVRARQSQQFWVSTHVSKSAIPGTYRTTLVIRAERGDTASIPMEVKVLPFALSEGMWWGVYYYSGFNPNTSRDFADLKAHGVNSILFCPPGHREPVLRREGDRVVASFPMADKAMAELKRQGFTRPVAYFPRLLSSRVLDMFNHVDGKQFKGASYYGQGCVRFSAQDYPEDLRLVLRDIFVQMTRHAVESDWPEILWYLVDEPGATPEGEMELEWAKLEYPLFREACPKARTLCTTYTLEVMAALDPYVDVRVTDLWRVADEQANRRWQDSVRKSGGALWGIRWLCQHNTYLEPRYFAGLGPVKFGLTGMTEWTYYGAAELGDGYGQLRNKEGCHYAYVDDQERLLSTIPWEAVQEGMNDARYVATLRELIARAKALGTAQHAVVAGEADRAMQSVIERLPWGAGKTVPEAELDGIRMIFTREILRLINSGVSLPLEAPQTGSER